MKKQSIDLTAKIFINDCGNNRICVNSIPIRVYTDGGLRIHNWAYPFTGWSKHYFTPTIETIIRSDSRSNMVDCHCLDENFRNSLIALDYLNMRYDNRYEIEYSYGDSELFSYLYFDRDTNRTWVAVYTPNQDEETLLRIFSI